MNYEDKKKIIVDTLTLHVGLFNPKKSPKKDTDYQFSFNEPEGNYEFYLAIRNRTCKFVEGRAPSPAFHIITSVDTWNKIGGGYMSGKEAGNEIIRFKKVSRKTRKTIQQKLRSKPMYISASNILMDKMIQEKKLPFQRNL